MLLLAVEFAVLYFVVPTLFAYTRHRLPAIPALWAGTAYCMFVLLHDPRFDRGRLWEWTGFRQWAPSILGLFAIAAVIGIALILRYAPERFLNLPRANPGLWAIVMVLYPVLSVYPQGIVYRLFLFERYRALFGGGWGIALASAIAFAYVHIVFRNPLAVGLTLLGGILFALRYLQTDSVLVTCFEHALYGCALFTIGLGRWFYYGAARV